MISEVSGQGTDFNIRYKNPFRCERWEGNTEIHSTEDPVTISGQKTETLNKVNHSGEDSAEVEELKRRDRKLRQNAAVHGSSLIYQTGPDGHIYVAGRKVSLDSSEVPNNPGATIDKALKIRRAVNSQEEPSLQDLQLLVTASKMEARARAELMRESKEIRGGIISFVDIYV